MVALIRARSTESTVFSVCHIFSAVFCFILVPCTSFEVQSFCWIVTRSLSVLTERVQLPYEQLTDQ